MKTTEKLPENMGSGHVEVEWEIGDRFDEAGDGYCFFHFADGISEHGHMFTATANLCMGDIDSIDDVEFVGMQQWLPEEDK
jgi:hypothetical protein